MMAQTENSVAVGKIALVALCWIIVMALCLLFSIIGPGTSAFIANRGWGDLLFGYGFMAGPGVGALGLSVIYLRRGVVPGPLLFFAGAAAVYSLYVAYQFAVY